MKLFKILLILLVFLQASSCYYMQKMTAPIPYTEYPTTHSDAGTLKSDRRLFILLPGVGDNEKSFADHGFIKALQSKYTDFDVITVSAHIKYYEPLTIVDRIREDIVLSAINVGYKEIYIGGISLGGLGSLLYLKNYPSELAGVLILAPYLAEREYFGYLIDGQAEPENLRDRNIWPWLSSLSPETNSKIYLAYGEQDKFNEALSLLRIYLPKNHTISVQGVHRWSTWKKLWPMLLDKALNDSI